MTTENIKAIIDLFGNLGASGKEAFLWYIGFEFLKVLIVASAVFAISVKIIKAASGEGPMASQFVRLRDEFDCGTGDIDSYQISKTISEIMDMKEANKALRNRLELAESELRKTRGMPTTQESRKFV